MGRIEQRAAKRVDCEFPTRLAGTKGPLDATVCDLSRTGVKLQVSGATLGIHRLSSLVQVAKRVSDSLGASFVAKLHHERLGNLVSKVLRPIRIGQRNWEQADVELGCRVDGGISDEEAGMLGIALPKVGAIEAPSYLTGAGPEVRDAPTPRRWHNDSTPVEPAPDPAPSTPEVPEVSEYPVETPADPSHQLELNLVPEPEPESQPKNAGWAGRPVSGRHRVYVRGRASGRGASFQAVTEAVSQKCAVLRIRNIDQLVGAEAAEGVSKFVMAFDAMYGEELSLRIMDGTRHLWSGPATVRCMELPPEAPGTALLTVAYSRKLRPAELREFGLV